MTKYLLALALLLGCAPVKDPCSAEALNKITVECSAEIALWCVRGDKSCPRYQECKAKIEEWRTCK